MYPKLDPTCFGMDFQRIFALILHSFWHLFGIKFHNFGDRFLSDLLDGILIDFWSTIAFKNSAEAPRFPHFFAPVAKCMFLKVS